MEFTHKNYGYKQCNLDAEAEAPTKSLSPNQSPRYHKTRYFSRHFAYAANDTALNTVRPIRPCFTANNKAYNPPTPHFHYANIAYGTQFSNGLCYTQAVQPYLVQHTAKCPLLQSTVVF